MEEKTCGNCKYFWLHYVRIAKGRYMALLYGHCVHLRLKKRGADQIACIDWKCGNQT